MDYLNKIIEDIETHSVDGIKECFENGVNPNDYFRNEPLIYELTSEYLRGPNFKNCVNEFVDYGLVFNDKELLSVLLDDANSLYHQLKKSPEIVDRRYNLRCAFTPLYEVTLLHICAEFNHVSCAEVLIKQGADINAKAGIDKDGFGGQTPIFHTVNQIMNYSIDMLNLLLEKSSNLKYTVAGFIWGKGYDWETLIPSVNPISYTMMGLLPQIHRDEIEISEIVSRMLKAAYGINYKQSNVPNRYLKN